MKVQGYPQRRRLRGDDCTKFNQFGTEFQEFELGR